MKYICIHVLRKFLGVAKFWYTNRVFLVLPGCIPKSEGQENDPRPTETAQTAHSEIKIYVGRSDYKKGVHLKMILKNRRGN